MKSDISKRERSLRELFEHYLLSLETGDRVEAETMVKIFKNEIERFCKEEK